MRIALIYGTPVQAPKGGRCTVPNLTERTKDGAERRIIAGSTGLPLASTITATDIHDSTIALRLVDAMPPVRHGLGRPRRRPSKLEGDKAYDFEDTRRRPRRREIKPLLSERRRAGRYRKL
jgi:hypothetical protein